MTTARRRSALLRRLPPVRGRLEPNRPLADLTWFRVGGPGRGSVHAGRRSRSRRRSCAHRLAMPVYVIGVGSNLLVRDGGVPGVVIRLGRGFGESGRGSLAHRIAPARGARRRVARFALDHGIGGLTFLRGIPGTIGGALRMNGGAYGGETKDVLVEARAVDRRGTMHVLSNADMHYGYRHCGAPEDLIFTAGPAAGRGGDPAEIAARHGGDHPQARGDAAGQEPHRRLDLQESARPQILAAHRQGRPARLRRSARRRSPSCTATS